MKRWTAAVLPAVLLGGLLSPVTAAPPEEAVLPLDKYSTPKGRSLGAAYEAQLRRFSERLYHCAPWVDVRRQGLGFNRPRFATGDDRYLSVWLEIDQHEDGRFAALGPDGRQSAMFSRYGVEMLRRLTALEGLRTEPTLEGFGVILSWPKPGTNGRPGVQPVNETLALFVSRAPLLEFLARTLPASELAARARFTLFDGQREVGRLPLEIWDDPFMTTFKLKDYHPPTGFRC
ncbi:MAG: hypothetical protein HYS36_05190 [Candidatus Rokubacteria bacterium]|nr:hypothetical protein [Candidatus Rokubacteria bacterium]MBI2524505.1 hypothetical protein [Candidatus Rokubacteria bacterium]